MSIVKIEIRDCTLLLAFELLFIPWAKWGGFEIDWALVIWIFSWSRTVAPKALSDTEGAKGSLK